MDSAPLSSSSSRSAYPLRCVLSAQREKAETGVLLSEETVAITAVLSVGDPALRAQLHHLLRCQPDVHEIINSQRGRADNQTVLFYDSQAASTNLPTADWVVALGGSNNDALAAFKNGAQGFICCPLNNQQATGVIQHLIQCMIKDVQRKRSLDAVKTTARRFSIGPEKVALGCQSGLSGQPRQIILRSENAWCSVFCDDIQWIQAAGDYMCVYTNNETLVIRSTLTQLCHRLPQQRFKRVSRSELVNITFVKCIEQRACRTAYVVLQNDTHLKISQRYFSAYWQSVTNFNR